ncbi:MAG: exodeoxyribonuclease V alpha subunit [Chlamydiales bacterium]
MTGEPTSRRGSEDSAGTALTGTIERVTYHDERSLYTVIKVFVGNSYDPPKGMLFGSDRITAVGRAVDPTEGSRVRLNGQWGQHASHGAQFEFDHLEPLPPIGSKGLVRYLSSKAFEGIGETLAKRIVEKLGDDTLEIIRDQPEQLTGIRGLRPEVAAGLSSAVQTQLAAHVTGAFLRDLGLGPLRAQATVRKLGADCEAKIRADPYQLARVPGLGFATADQIGSQLDFLKTDRRRLAAGLLHQLAQNSKEGHTFARRAAWIAATNELLDANFTAEDYGAAIEALEDEDEIVVEDSLGQADQDEGSALVYIPWLAASERGLARNISQLLDVGEAEPLAEPRLLEAAEREAKIELHPAQRDAITELLATPVGLLTGGPGVGKTTIVRFVASLAEANGLKVVLASPTGRAAKRLSEATGRPASTIHRMLGYQAEGGGFEHGTDKPIEAGLVLVDEISMLDVVLAHHLVKAIKPPTRLILVGDPDQLPSVGPGNVLRDLLDSGRVTVCRLTQIFRQDAGSLIVTNAHRILSGEELTFPAPGTLDQDFYFFPAEDPAATCNRLVDVVTNRIPSAFGFNWVEDVQVIAPMYRGDCGVDTLNDRLRDAQGVGGREVVRGRDRWRIGDRVIHTRNDYDKKVFNGDMGHIIEVTQSATLTVRFPDQDVVYEGAELSDLRPAFAITVHRSQGGEFPVVVLPLVTQHYMMLQRNLLYTAVTRARKLVVLVGSRRALQMAIDNDRQAQRESALCERLQQLRAEAQDAE